MIHTLVRVMGHELNQILMVDVCSLAPRLWQTTRTSSK
jgi:hypothetical protein